MAHIARELRARQAKLEKKGIAGRAGMTYLEVRRVFPHLKEATVRKYLAEVCDVTKVCECPLHIALMVLCLEHMPRRRPPRHPQDAII